MSRHDRALGAHFPGVQEIVRKRMKQIELGAFVCGPDVYSLWKKMEVNGDWVGGMSLDEVPTPSLSFCKNMIRWGLEGRGVRRMSF